MMTVIPAGLASINAGLFNDNIFDYFNFRCITKGEKKIIQFELCVCADDSTGADRIYKFLIYNQYDLLKLLIAIDSEIDVLNPFPWLYNIIDIELSDLDLYHNEFNKEYKKIANKIWDFMLTYVVEDNEQLSF